MKKLLIMRGPSGAGKDYWISHNAPNAKIISTDNYFMVNGEYKFDITRLAEYHNYTLRDCVAHLQIGTPFIVINNTNTRVFEIAPYYRLGEAFGYEVEIVWIIAHPDKCKAHTQHNVPPQNIDKMFFQAEPLPDWWNVTVVIND